MSDHTDTHLLPHHTCPQEERLRDVENVLRPIKLISPHTLTLVVALVGAAALWWLQQFFVPASTYDRDRNADREMLREMRQDIKVLLGAKHAEMASIKIATQEHP